MAARDLWIGWDDATRGRNLQRVVNNQPLSDPSLGAGAKPREQGAIPDGAISFHASGTAAMGWSPCCWRPWWITAATAATCYRAANWIVAWSDDGAGADGPRAPSSRRKLENGAGLASGDRTLAGCCGRAERWHCSAFELCEETFGMSRDDLESIHRVSTFCRIEADEPQRRGEAGAREELRAFA